MPTPREASIWGKIRTDLSEAQQDILNGRYADAMILNREILKRIVRMQIDRAVLVSNNLENDIDQLFDNRLISHETHDQYQAIRLYADQAESGVTPTAQAANDSFSLLKDALSDYVDSNSQRTGGNAYETRSYQSTGRFSSGYTGPSAASSYGSDAEASDSYTTSAASAEDYGASDATPDDSYSTTGDLDTDAYAASGTSETATADEFDSAMRTSAPRTAFDASGVDLPLRSAPRRNTNVQRRSNRNANQRPSRPLRDSERVSRNGNRRPSGTASGKRASANAGRRNTNRPRGGRNGKRQEIDLYFILKYLIPIVCLILLVILIRVLMHGSSPSTIETTPAPTVAVTETAVETEPTIPETEAPTEAAPAVYMTTTGVKVRTEPNTDCRVLDVIDAGTTINYKGEENGWVNIDFNGENAYIKAEFVQAIAAETPAA